MALMEMESVDWEKGLPPDVLPLVAKAGGLPDMKSMRGACKTWQEGFELGVTGIGVSILSPMLPDGGLAARRFPMLARLDVGNSSAAESWLQTLAAFPKLSSLVLGYKADSASRLSLSRCLSDAGLGLLRGLPLAHLDLSGCAQLTPGDLTVLRGMPLTSLSVHRVEKLTDAGMDGLRGMWIRALDLTDCECITDAALECFRGMPLTKLGLKRCRQLTPGGLECLRGMPITALDLSHCRALISDAAMEVLQGLPLADLSLACGHDLLVLETQPTDLKNDGMGVLAGFPLTSLDVSW